MPYTPLEWKDGPEGGTPISAANLNRMEQGIKDAHDLAASIRNNVMHVSATGRNDASDVPDGNHVPAWGGEITRLQNGQTINIWAVDYNLRLNWRVKVRARDLQFPPSVDDIFVGNNTWHSERATGDAPLASYTASDTRIITIDMQNQTGGTSDPPTPASGVHITYTITE